MHIFILISILVVFVIAVYEILEKENLVDENVESKITGICCVNEDNAEMVIRECADYIQKNNIVCFRKILLVNESRSEETAEVCSKMCEKYPFFVLCNENVKIADSIKL